MNCNLTTPLQRMISLAMSRKRGYYRLKSSRATREDSQLLCLTLKRGLRPISSVSSFSWFRIVGALASVRLIERWGVFCYFQGSCTLDFCSTKFVERKKMPLPL